MKMDTARKIGWKTWFGILVLIAATIVAVDIYYEKFYVGATMRFVWNLVIFALLWLVRSIESLLVPFARYKSRKMTAVITGIGLGYASSVILNDEQVRKAFTTREKVRVLFTRIRNAWVSLHVSGKCAVVVGLIAAQMYLVPMIATYFILFPVAFMVPYLILLKEWLVHVVADSFVSRWYWQNFGRSHRAFMQFMRSRPIVQMAVGATYLMRLMYLTAWRLWRHAECYKMARGRRRISLFEPVRLWWRGELYRYVGRPLLSGKRNPWPVFTYVPPKLWYEHDNPYARMLVAAGALTLAMIAIRGSSRRH